MYVTVMKGRARAAWLLQLRLFCFAMVFHTHLRVNTEIDRVETLTFDFS